jgi:hypothetical protein
MARVMARGMARGMARVMARGMARIMAPVIGRHGHSHGPGATALTRVPWQARSLASTCVSPITAPLEAS